MSKQEAEWCKRIEIWWLLRDIKQRGGYKYTTISWGENGSRGSVSVEVVMRESEKYARFIYTQTDNYTNEKKNFDYKVPIIQTPCNYGGYRYWFRCTLSKNGQYCGRRIGVLYKDGDWFGCRHCYDITYSSRNVNPNYRHYPYFKILDLDSKIEKICQKTKRYTYRGKPTKKMRKIEKLTQQAEHYYKSVEKSL